MSKPILDADAQCPICQCEAVAMVIDGGHGVSWCADGHVAAFGSNFPTRQVFDFKEDAPPVPMRGFVKA